MTEREADRAHPERLRQQAVVALMSDADRALSPEFRQRLRAYDSDPCLFDASDLAALARTLLEAEIARAIEVGQESYSATCDALRRQGEGWSREQKCNLIADRDPNTSVASASMRKACEEAAPIAAGLILKSERASRINDRVRLDENLLVRPSGGASL